MNVVILPEKKQYSVFINTKYNIVIVPTKKQYTVRVMEDIV